MQQEEKSRVLVLGYGEMGHAMEYLLGPRHHLSIWQRRPAPGTTPVALEQAASNSDFILFCLPATAHAEVARRVAPQLHGDTLCLTIAKGVDENGHTPAETLTSAFGAARVAVLYGPMISEEIRAGKRAYAQCGARDDTSCTRIAALYRDSALRLEPSRDVTGLSWSAILKNVYAMAFGMADELNFGDNVRGFLAVAALHELAAVARALGGESDAPWHLAGLGDLITTATSSGSHHHELGRLIVRGEHECLVGEGIHTLAMLRAARRFDVERYPLFHLIDASVREPVGARARLGAFLAHASA